MSLLESSVRCRELGRRLLAAQKKAGFSGGQLAELMQWSASKLSRTMSGHRAAIDTEVATILALCGIAGTERDDVLRFCYPHQDTSLHLPADEQWPVYLIHAREAVRLVDFHPTIVPWLLQTPDYTRALVVDGARPDTYETEIKARRAAVQLLDTPRVEVLLHEWSLRTPLRDEAMMCDQLHHLLRMSVQVGISIRVIPADRGAYFGRHGGFTLLEFDDHPPVLYREDFTAGVLLDHGPDVATYRWVAKSLDALALDEQGSRDLIAEIAINVYGGAEDEQVPRLGLVRG